MLSGVYRSCIWKAGNNINDIFDKPTMHKINFLYVLFLFCGNTLFAQKIDKNQIIGELRAIRNTLEDISSDSAISRQQLADCKAVINEAIINIDSRTLNYDVTYLQSLTGLLHFANQLNEKQFNQAKMIFMLDKDLRLKFKYHANGISNLGYIQLVPVTVVTKGRSGLRVNYTPLGYPLDYKKPAHRFARLTTPATAEMVPGIYQLWITRDGDTKMIRIQQVEVDPGKSDHTIEFEVQGN